MPLLERSPRLPDSPNLLAAPPTREGHPSGADQNGSLQWHPPFPWISEPPRLPNARANSPKPVLLPGHRTPCQATACEGEVERCRTAATAKSEPCLRQSRGCDNPACRFSSGRVGSGRVCHEQLPWEMAASPRRRGFGARGSDPARGIAPGPLPRRSQFCPANCARPYGQLITHPPHSCGVGQPQNLQPQFLCSDHDPQRASWLGVTDLLHDGPLAPRTHPNTSRFKRSFHSRASGLGPRIPMTP